MGAVQNIAKNFAQHEIMRVQQAKSWRVNKPGTWTYGFTITWSPGMLALAGDLNELIVYHANAMPTLDATLNWLDDIEFDYFMRKTGQKRVFSPEQTVKLMVKAADADAKRDEKAPLWKSIFEKFSHHVEVGEDNHLTPEFRAAIADAIENDIELTPADIYAAFGEADFIVETWTTQHRYQFEAIMAWHRLMRAQPEPDLAAILGIGE